MEDESGSNRGARMQAGASGRAFVQRPTGHTRRMPQPVPMLPRSILGTAWKHLAETLYRVDSVWIPREDIARYCREAALETLDAVLSYQSHIEIRRRWHYESALIHTLKGVLRRDYRLIERNGQISREHPRDDCETLRLIAMVRAGLVVRQRDNRAGALGAEERPGPW